MTGRRGTGARPALARAARVLAALALAALVAACGVAADVREASDGTLERREAAARATDVGAMRDGLAGLAGWTPVAAVAEAAYYTQGSAPVHAAWGFAPPADTVGPDAAAVLDGLRAAPVRFLALVQCAGVDRYTVAVAFGAGDPSAAGQPPATIAYARFAAPDVRCDGRVHATASDAFTIPAAADPAGQWVHLFLGENVDEASSADRVVVLVAPAAAALPDAATLESLGLAAFGGVLP